jgi:integrase
MLANAASGLLDNRGFRRNVFDPSVIAHGLSPSHRTTGVTRLRGWRVSAGANVKAVQGMLGHASAAMALDVYSGLLADDLDDVALGLNESAHVHRSTLELCR